MVHLIESSVLPTSSASCVVLYGASLGVDLVQRMIHLPCVGRVVSLELVMLRYLLMMPLACHGRSNLPLILIGQAAAMRSIACH